jgi:hypothetical protein
MCGGGTNGESHAILAQIHLVLENRKDANLFFWSSGNLPLELLQFSFDPIKSSFGLIRIGWPLLKNLIEQP